MELVVLKTGDFEEWFRNQSKVAQLQIDARINRLRKHEHLGDYKLIAPQLIELRWKNGRRVYIAFKGKEAVICLNGGGKGGQEKDIKKAKKICEAIQTGFLEIKGY